MVFDSRTENTLVIVCADFFLTVIGNVLSQECSDVIRLLLKLKQRLVEEGNETVTNCHQLKMPASDGKMRLTDVANTEQLFRIIQSIPSPKAEPFKVWLASICSDRLDEIADPEQAIDRALMYYKAKGYSDAWINQRLKSIEVRNDLTDCKKCSAGFGKGNWRFCHYKQKYKRFS